MNLESLKWDKKCELDLSYDNAIREGSTFYMNGIEMQIKNADTYREQLLIEYQWAKETNNLNCTVDGKSVCREGVYQTYLNVSAWIEAQQLRLKELQDLTVGASSFSAVRDIVWSNASLSMTDTPMAEALQYKPEEYQLSGRSTYTITHQWPYKPRVNVYVGGQEVLCNILQEDGLITILFSQITGCSVTIS